MTVVEAAKTVTHLVARRSVMAARPVDPLDLSAVVDLLAIATTAGLPTATAVEALSGRVDAPFDEALDRATAALHAGADRRTAVETLFAPAGHLGRRVASSIAVAERDGASVTLTLTRASADLELVGRSEAEARARRLPVRLLFPLVFCVLPAFALLTVVPLLAGSLGSLPI